MKYKKMSKPGALFNAHKAMAMKKKRKLIKAGGHEMGPIVTYKNNQDINLARWSGKREGTPEMKPATFVRGRNTNPLTTVGGKPVGAGYKFKGKKRTKSAKKHKYMPSFGSRATKADRTKYPAAEKIMPTSVGQKAINRMNNGDSSGLKMGTPTPKKGGPLDYYRNKKRTKRMAKKRK